MKNIAFEDCKVFSLSWFFDHTFFPDFSREEKDDLKFNVSRSQQFGIVQIHRSTFLTSETLFMNLLSDQKHGEKVTRNDTDRDVTKPDKEVR